MLCRQKSAFKRAMYDKVVRTFIMKLKGHLAAPVIAKDWDELQEPLHHMAGTQMVEMKDL